MGNHTIKVNIEIVECSAPEQQEPLKQGAGHFELTLGESDSRSLDRCEQALLKTNAAAMREALSVHFTELSKKVALEQAQEGEVKSNEHDYQVEGEVGRFTFKTHRLESAGEVIFNTKGSLFAQLKGKEWYKTTGFKEISMIYGATEDSYRKTTQLINRIRHQEGATPMRTLKENTEEEGKKLIDFVERKTQAILSRHHFTDLGQPKEASVTYQQAPELTAEEPLKKALEVCQLSPEEVAEIQKNPVPYEAPEGTVNISIDEVGAKKQKQSRGVGEEDSGKKKYVHNTVAHIQKGEKSYVVNGYSPTAVLRIIIAFLLNNHLLKYRLQFFVDGQRSLHHAIMKAFSWFNNIGIILDWYHLEEKCKMQLSLAMKGKEIRHAVLETLMPLLWYGRVDQAIDSLNQLDETLIKDKNAVEKLINYIDRNRLYIPCYGVRRALGLRNSSNIGEKMNDLVVADRQKHNGMSWSQEGSVTLASLEVIKRNEEYHRWFEKGDLALQWVA
jgi:hypothetical protein